MVREHVGSDLTELAYAMMSVLPSEDSNPVIWNPHAGDGEVVANLKNIVQAMAARTSNRASVFLRRSADGRCIHAPRVTGT